MRRERLKCADTNGGGSHPIRGLSATISASIARLLVENCLVRALLTCEGMPRPGRIHLTNASLLLAVAVGATACMELSPAEVAVVSEVVNYRSEGFARINAVPYQSDIDQRVAIDVWINSEAAALYAKISPDVEGSGV